MFEKAFWNSTWVKYQISKSLQRNKLDHRIRPATKPLQIPKHRIRPWKLSKLAVFNVCLMSLQLACQGATVVAWGGNHSGQTDVPPGLTNVIAIAAGRSHSLALKADGTIVGWGGDEMGLKNPPMGLSNVIAICAGASNTMALKADGSVRVWGNNNFGPVYVPPGLTN